MMKSILTALLITIVAGTYGQAEISNKAYFRKFLKPSHGKSLLILGENHGSMASAVMYPAFVKYLTRKTGLRSLLIEFGPSEAYFYNKYLETGNEKHLNYTLYAGAIREWRDAWKMLYDYNKKLKKPIKVIGIDFDRTRTMAYAIYSMFLNYDQKPQFVEALMKEISGPDFYSSYTIGYPNKKDIEWTNKTKALLRDNIDSLRNFLSEKDMKVFREILENKAVNYADGREEALYENTKRIISESADSRFFLLIGRSHAYLNPIFADSNRLAKRISQTPGIKMLTGSILYEDSEFGTSKDKPITLFEISNKDPWKAFYPEINKEAPGEYHIVPLKKKLAPLAHYLDYILVARNQVRYTLINQKAK